MEDALEVRYEEGVTAGIRESTITSIKNIMKNLHKSADEAMDILDIPREESVPFTGKNCRRRKKYQNRYLKNNTRRSSISWTDRHFGEK